MAITDIRKCNICSTKILIDTYFVHISKCWFLRHWQRIDEQSSHMYNMSITYRFRWSRTAKTINTMSNRINRRHRITPTAIPVEKHNVSSYSILQHIDCYRVYNLHMSFGFLSRFSTTSLPLYCEWIFHKVGANYVLKYPNLKTGSKLCEQSSWLKQHPTL